MTEWGTLLPNGNVCKWETEAQARQAALMSESFPDGAHPLVSRECSEWAPAKPTDKGLPIRGTVVLP